MYGHCDTVIALVDAGAYANLADLHGTTPLINLKAAKAGHDNVVIKLIDAGADINKAKDSTGTTPLIVAARAGHDKLSSHCIH